MDGRKKKRNKGKKTPMEFEKRLIAGTKRYYQTKLEKLKSNSKGNLSIIERFERLQCLIKIIIMYRLNFC